MTLWCVHVPFCVSQNLFNQGLQFDLSSATFIRIVSKKKKPSSSALYIYIWFCYYSDIGLNILANTWNFDYIEFWASLGCVNNLETKCWIDVRTYANQIHCVLQHSLTQTLCTCVHMWNFRLKKCVSELWTLLRSAESFLMRLNFWQMQCFKHGEPKSVNLGLGWWWWWWGDYQNCLYLIKARTEKVESAGLNLAQTSSGFHQHWGDWRWKSGF